MRTNYDINMKPTDITQAIINKIETLYLKEAYGKNIDKYTWNRPVGTTIKVEDIKSELAIELNKERKSFEDFEVSMYKEDGKIIAEFYSELREDELTLNNKNLEFHSNPCYGAYVEGMSFADMNLKIKFIVSNGAFYIFLENSEWNCRNLKLDNSTLRKWNNMIVNIYTEWLANDIPVHVPSKYRQKVRKKIIEKVK